MLRNIHELKGYKLHAKDDEFGKVKDFLFDEEHWTIRYMVADTGRWLPGRKVLVSPVSLKKPDWDGQCLHVDLAREMIEKAPLLDEDAPVSRRYERDWSNYIGYPYYWGTMFSWGAGYTPWEMLERRSELYNPEEEGNEDDMVLRSVEEVRGYQIMAGDEKAGYVDDFILDDKTWTIRYLVLDTREWLPGRRSLIAPKWAKKIDWASRRIDVDMTLDEIKSIPAFNPELPITREFEERIFSIFERSPYWVEAT